MTLQEFPDLNDFEQAARKAGPLGVSLKSQYSSLQTALGGACPTSRRSGQDSAVTGQPLSIQLHRAPVFALRLSFLLGLSF